MRSLPLVACLGLVSPASVFPQSQPDLATTISQLGLRENFDYHFEFEILMSAPSEAAGLLVDELRVIEPVPEFVSPLQVVDSEANRAALHVVWCLRALRYITGGLDFRAPTTHQFGSEERFREQWLRKGSFDSTVSFFGTRMSTDTVYIAPTDAQEQIIQKWRTWCKEDGANYQFRAAKELEDWYF
jgi:hypothetical protein